MLDDSRRCVEEYIKRLSDGWTAVVLKRWPCLVLTLFIFDRFSVEEDPCFVRYNAVVA